MNRDDGTCQKAPFLSHLFKGHPPRRFVACQYAFWQIPVSLYFSVLFCWCPVSLLWLKQHGTIWHWPTLILEIISLWKLFWALSIHHQVSTSREVCYSSMDLKFMKALNSLLSPPCLPMIFFPSSWDNSLLLSVVHVLCGTHHDTKQHCDCPLPFKWPLVKFYINFIFFQWFLWFFFSFFNKRVQSN